ncbi:MAG: MgtC/SapB family protein [Candidatus Villigracilaceae bacterium]
MFLLPEDVTKILLALLAGGLIGIEREFRDKAAGFRTLIFIAIGSTLFTILSIKLPGAKDAARIAANIVTGVGFLGAGVILRDGGRVVGLTTAATIWMTSAIGMALGSGEYLLAGLIVLIALIVLWIFPYFDAWVDSRHNERTYEIAYPANPEKFVQIEAVFKACGLYVQNRKQIRSEIGMTCTWHARGSAAEHARLVEKILQDPEIKEFRF